MLFEVYATLIGIVLLVVGLIWLLIRRPVTRRWQIETQIEEEQREAKKQEEEQRQHALRELDTWVHGAPDHEESQENRKS